MCQLISGRDTILGRGSRYKKGNEIAAFNYCGLAEG